jgi:Domain of unknown function (DUF4351)
MSAAAREALQNMDPAKLEYQSGFARRHVAQGRAEGRIEGGVEVFLRQLQLRFGSLPAETEARVRAGSPNDLDTFAERILTAATLDQTLARPHQL